MHKISGSEMQEILFLRQLEEHSDPGGGGKANGQIERQISGQSLLYQDFQTVNQSLRLLFHIRANLAQLQHVVGIYFTRLEREEIMDQVEGFVVGKMGCRRTVEILVSLPQGETSWKALVGNSPV